VVETKLQVVIRNDLGILEISIFINTDIIIELEHLPDSSVVIKRFSGLISLRR